VPDPQGFLTIRRRIAPYRPVEERVRDHRHPALPAAVGLVREQAARCMGCGVPFCHSGCPLGNLVPDWNELVRTGRFRDAADRLHQTNNFPELTGLLCPAPCEEACVLALNDDPVTIKQVELAIIERAFASGWVKPRPPAAPTGQRVAIVGSGPAGLAAAQELTRAGHAVSVFERDDRPGGLLRYGIPDFKLEKWMIDRRVQQVLEEGVEIETGVDVGTDIDGADLRGRFDAVLLATGAQRGRPLDIPGAWLPGVAQAMAYLRQRNRRVAGLPVAEPPITAEGRHVVVLGGGDTSADCLGCATRESARSVTEVAHGPVPPRRRSPRTTWPAWPSLLRTYPAHDEGGTRAWEIEVTAIEGGPGGVRAVRGHRVEFPGFTGAGPRPAAVPTTAEVVLPADLVLVAIGFAGVEDDSVYASCGVEVTEAGTVAEADGVFAAGDCVRGADLIVTAIAEGRAAARRISAHLRARV
jgi:glutamate synthase (NADPH) small chain